MASTTTVCSMCGDVGFPDKLFQCIRCLSRFQHSYCSNYYEEPSETTDGICDWCLSEERRQHGGHHHHHSKKHAPSAAAGPRSEYPRGDKGVKQGGEGREEAGGAGAGRGGKNSGSSSANSSKTGGRRYKLLKDVLC